MTSSSLVDFLSESKSAFAKNKESSNKNHHIVIGNPAGDADSIVSALTYWDDILERERDDNRRLGRSIKGEIIN